MFICASVQLSYSTLAWFALSKVEALTNLQIGLLWLTIVMIFHQQWKCEQPVMQETFSHFWPLMLLEHWRSIFYHGAMCAGAAHCLYCCWIDTNVFLKVLGRDSTIASFGLLLEYLAPCLFMCRVLCPLSISNYSSYSCCMLKVSCVPLSFSSFCH